MNTQYTGTQDIDALFAEDRLAHADIYNISTQDREYLIQNWFKLEEKLGKKGVQVFADQFIDRRIQYYKESSQQRVVDIVDDQSGVEKITDSSQNEKELKSESKVATFDRILYKDFNISHQVIKKLTYPDKKIIRNWDKFKIAYKNRNNGFKNFNRAVSKSISMYAVSVDSGLNLDQKQEYLENIFFNFENIFSQELTVSDLITDKIFNLGSRLMSILRGRNNLEPQTT